MNQKNALWEIVQDLRSKKDITEIVINNINTIFVERKGQFIQLKVEFCLDDIKEFISDIAKFNGKDCNQSHPLLNGLLPTGERINIVHAPIVKDVAAITIRLYQPWIKSFKAHPEIFGLGDKWCEFFIACVAAKVNFIISGGTGAGKTTFLNLLLQEISPNERVITIEDTRELNINADNWVSLQSPDALSHNLIGARTLVKNSLRMRPDRIILGEVRGGEMFDLTQIMNTGHDGSMTSIHSNGAAECLQRMESLYLTAGLEVPVKAIRKQISTAVDFIIQLEKNRDGERVVAQISEITGMEGSNILLSQIASLDEKGKLVSQGIAPSIMDRIHIAGDIPMDFFRKVVR